MSSSFLPLFAFIFFAISLSPSHARVPPSQTFTYVNEGDLGEKVVEYGDYRALPIGNMLFKLCFFNSTPNAFTLGIRMGSSDNILRWVWQANRARTVRDNATLSFNRHGNLVLADSDGTVVWQTGTANKGVVGLKLLENGNLVLHGRRGKFVWQSFDHPTDTLLVGQALRSDGPNELVSRVSYLDGSEGPFSFVMEQRHWAMYMRSNNSQEPLLYYKSDDLGDGHGSLAKLELYSEPEFGSPYATELGFKYNMTNSSTSGTDYLSRANYNSTYSFLRIESDGNLRIYTFYPNVDISSWEVTYKLFDREDGRDIRSECRLPTNCGLLGVCEGEHCVACPRPWGLAGWSKTCAPPVLPPCKGGANVDYYKVVGVEHFMNGYTEGDGPMSMVECKQRCDKDCGCLGFFYREESSKCLLAPELRSLIKVNNQSHVGYIKMSKGHV